MDWFEGKSTQRKPLFGLPIIQCWEHHPNISKHDPPQKKWQYNHPHDNQSTIEFLMSRPDNSHGVLARVDPSATQCTAHACRFFMEKSANWVMNQGTPNETNKQKVEFSKVLNFQSLFFFLGGNYTKHFGGYPAATWRAGKSRNIGHVEVLNIWGDFPVPYRDYQRVYYSNINSIYYIILYYTILYYILLYIILYIYTRGYGLMGI